jgi:hypothetical protein
MIYGAPKPKAHARFDHMTAIEHNSPVRKEGAAKLAQKCWKVLTRENVLDA